MLAQDAPTLSNAFILEFELSGKLDRDRLRAALERTVLQHPLAAATIDDSVSYWEVNWRAPEVLDEIDIEAPIRFDLHCENGIRIGLNDGASNSQKLIVVVHHACLDALGALQFVDDLKTNYAAPPDSFGDQSQQAVSYLKKYRWSYGGNRLLQVLRWPLDLVVMLWAYEVIFNRPKPIGVSDHRDPGQEETDQAETVLGDQGSPRATRTRQLDQNELARALTIARSSRQTLNDHLLSSCFLAIERWFEKFDPPNTKSLIRLFVPISLRRGTIQSASNMVAMVNMDKKPGKLRSVPSFRKLLAFQMDLVKRLRTGVTANRFLGLERGIFGRWRLFENDDRCHASCIVSNLGDLSKQIGDPDSGKIVFDQDTAVRSVHFVGPIRGQTHVCIHVWTYLDRMSLVATFNTNKLTPGQVDYLLENITEILLSDDETLCQNVSRGP